jgi:hypothetical protein
MQSLLNWVGPLIIIDNGPEDDNWKEDEEKIQIQIQYWCTYYQDRDKRYPFTTDMRGHNLLTHLIATKRKLLHINRCMMEKFATTTTTTITNTMNNGNVCVVPEEFVNNYDGDDAMDVIIQIVQGLYAHKPTLRTKGVTWSTKEYSHPGLQRMYLRMKSIQRFTKVWSLLERAEALGCLTLHLNIVEIACIVHVPHLYNNNWICFTHSINSYISKHFTIERLLPHCRCCCHCRCQLCHTSSSHYFLSFTIIIVIGHTL